MTDNNETKRSLYRGVSLTRRSAFTVLGASLALTKAAFALPAKAQSQFRNLKGANIMSQISMKNVNEIGRGGLLVVAQWEAKEGKADAVVDTLRDRFGINIDDIGERSMLEARIEMILEN